ncbi:phosphonoacetaldehyde hydrolase [Marmoricola endophyticus]|uniref:Phosphonoacetaldehyde hydrolase n=1 Tax=Marmoricola endophyticus TaxID=2040280 RepID=A0A917FA52_9ACTN|nr:phosphonatase-like hydrolase [Marmoricola endophyticus]GGF56938.1 phosphonoacetaldehyde hydrolase [Marmoricola endophyticus]
MTATAHAFDLVSLDMAGTTVEEGGLVYRVLDQTVADVTGRPVPHDLLLAWKGTSKREAVAGLLAGMDAPCAEADVDTAFEEFSARLVQAYRDTPPEPMPGVPEMFASLRSRGVKVALQTGYPAEIADAILEGLGWRVGSGGEATVDAVVTSDRVAASRPAPYLVFHTMEATGVTDVRRVLVAGDTPNDLGAGTQAGAGFVVGVLSGSFDETALAAEPHTHVMASVTGIADLL